jgi:hypothetical protein
MCGASVYQQGVWQPKARPKQAPCGTGFSLPLLRSGQRQGNKGAPPRTFLRVSLTGFVLFFVEGVNRLTLHALSRLSREYVEPLSQCQSYHPAPEDGRMPFAKQNVETAGACGRLTLWIACSLFS